MLHKWEAIMGLPEDSLAYQMEEHYLESAYPEEPEDGQEETLDLLTDKDYCM